MGISGYSKEDALAIVPLRAGSKGLPGKNLRLLSGKPLYRIAEEQALRVVGRCVISTDIEEILLDEHDARCTVLHRPEELAGDSVSMDRVIAHVLGDMKSKVEESTLIVLLQATSPLREDRDIDAAVRLFRTGKFDLVMSIAESDSSLLKAGTLCGGEFLPVAEAKYCFMNRQVLPPVYRPNGAVYVFSAASFTRNNGFPNSKIGAIEMPDHRSIDIDSERDLEEVQRVFENRE